MELDKIRAVCLCFWFTSGRFCRYCWCGENCHSVAECVTDISRRTGEVRGITAHTAAVQAMVYHVLEARRAMASLVVPVGSVCGQEGRGLQQLCALVACDDLRNGNGWNLLLEYSRRTVNKQHGGGRSVKETTIGM